MKETNLIEQDYLARVRMAHTNHNIRAREFRKVLAEKRKELDRMEKAVLAEFETSIEGSLAEEESEVMQALAWRRAHEGKQS